MSQMRGRSPQLLPEDHPAEGGFTYLSQLFAAAVDNIPNQAGKINHRYTSTSPGVQYLGENIEHAFRIVLSLVCRIDRVGEDAWSLFRSMRPSGMRHLR